MLIAVFLAGLRHGFDLDHIAAIADITSSQIERRRAYFLGTLYAVGHAVVLFVLGGIAIVVGRRIPETIDSAMERVIGASLVALGIYVSYMLIRFGRDASLRSRWMLVLAGLKRTLAWLRRSSPREIEITHEHAHPAVGHHLHQVDHPSSPAGTTDAPGSTLRTKTHVHTHTHVVRAADDPFAEYGVATSLGIGMIHGIGAETPSQIVLLTAAAGVAGTGGGVLVLCAFVAGLLLGNTVLVVSTATTFAHGRRLPVVYTVLATATAAVSIAVGTLYLVGRADLLPDFLGA